MKYIENVIFRLLFIRFIRFRFRYIFTNLWKISFYLHPKDHNSSHKDAENLDIIYNKYKENFIKLKNLTYKYYFSKNKDIKKEIEELKKLICNQYMNYRSDV